MLLGADSGTCRHLASQHVSANQTSSTPGLRTSTQGARRSVSFAALFPGTLFGFPVLQLGAARGRAVPSPMSCLLGLTWLEDSNHVLSRCPAPFQSSK